MVVLAVPYFIRFVTFVDDYFNIEEAFGSHPKSLGIVLIQDLPQSYHVYRERLLKLAFKFPKLDEATREKYADPGSRYRSVFPISVQRTTSVDLSLSFGSSHGKVLGRFQVLPDDL